MKVRKTQMIQLELDAGETDLVVKGLVLLRGSGSPGDWAYDGASALLDGFSDVVNALPKPPKRRRRPKKARPAPALPARPEEAARRLADENRTPDDLTGLRG